MNFFKKISYYMKISGSLDIARRYFVINAFDGSLSILGVIVGIFLSGVNDYKIYLAAGIGVSIAICVSGISSAYLSERAERIKLLKDVEKAMLNKLDKSVMGGATRTVPFIIAIVNGFSPFIASLIILSPFFFGKAFPLELLFYTFLGLCVFILFSLGFFLGRISKENAIISGVKTVFIGILVVIIITLINFF